ncbi:MAG: PhoPQ-activated pathogenicity-related family protein [Planctomycetaceae bacterium]|nr:PhoPQ-activated pathogenicity-related family protein [Planctomycetaceae bacterium]
MYSTRTLLHTFLLIIFLATTGCAEKPEAQAVPSEPALPTRTALDDYVAKPDDSYRWEVSSSVTEEGVRTVVIDMVSQSWRTKEDVDRTEWRHWLTLCIPEQIDSRVGGLMIGGGVNGKEARSSERIAAIARATNTVMAQLDTVPNQSLMFHGDGKQRTEDEIVAYTWDQYIKTGDETWPLFNPMVKSAVRAMDTITAFLASEAGGGHQVDQFVLSGASKRGWTTWLTGAVDNRVVGIIPIVIDVLNAQVSMLHHFEVYGFWAPTIGDYVQHKIMERMNEPRMHQLYQLIDPYQYRHRLDMPKLILNATGDQFFLPDSSKYYWDDLIGDKFLRYVPNGDHGLGGTDAFESVLAFHYLISHGKEVPTLSWTEGEDGTFIVSCEKKPQEVRLWYATNPEARDFRLETLGPEYSSMLLNPRADGKYVGKAGPPEQGWTAYFAEATFDVGAPTPLKLTTSVKILPEVEPYKGKDPSQPATLTILCTAPNEQAANSMTDQVKGMLTDKGLIAGRVTVKTRGTRCYINLEPKGDFRETLRLITIFLGTLNCREFAYQIESGSEITFPPLQQTR